MKNSSAPVSGAIFEIMRLSLVGNQKPPASSISGSGDVRIAWLEAKHLTVSIAGSGDFSAGGKANTVEAKIAGSGDTKMGKLAADNVKISIAGSGDATVWAKETLNVKVAGSGDVGYYGDATVTKTVAGSGNVKRLGGTP